MSLVSSLVSSLVVKCYQSIVVNRIGVFSHSILNFLFLIFDSLLICCGCLTIVIVVQGYLIEFIQCILQCFQCSLLCLKLNIEFVPCCILFIVSLTCCSIGILSITEVIHVVRSLGSHAIDVIHERLNVAFHNFPVVFKSVLARHALHTEPICVKLAGVLGKGRAGKQFVIVAVLIRICLQHIFLSLIKVDVIQRFQIIVRSFSPFYRHISSLLQVFDNALILCNSSNIQFLFALNVINEVFNAFNRVGNIYFIITVVLLLLRHTDICNLTLDGFLCVQESIRTNQIPLLSHLLVQTVPG